MSIGGFKAAKLRATTNQSTQSGVIIAYAANAKDTLTRVKNAIVGFGGWTWNNDLGFVSTDGTETIQYITYYTTLTHTNGAQLFISYGAAGVQFHWSCFAQYTSGSNTAYPTITESGTTYTLGDGISGGWFSGLCMSMIPAGSSNHYGTPNRTDNTWLPSDATPLIGYLGTSNATYKEATTVSTAARMTSGDEYIYIIAKDDLFMVMCHDPTWGGYSSNAGMGAPCYLGYVVGRLFENLADDDNAYYAPYGWWGGQTATRITLGSPYMRSWSAAYSQNGARTAPAYIGNNSIKTSQADFGCLGFFRKDGSKFSQEGPCGFFYAEATDEINASNAAWMYQKPQNARWYAMEVGILPISEAASFTNTPVAYGTQIKGTIRTDFMRPYVIVDPRYDTRFRVPPYGTKFENGNFIMGPCNAAIGWDASFTEAETEELCPWRGQSGFSYNSSVDFGGYNDLIQSIASNGSLVLTAGIDAATKYAYINFANISSTTFNTTVTVPFSIYGNNPLGKLLYNKLDSYFYYPVICSDNTPQRELFVYQIDSQAATVTLWQSTFAATSQKDLWLGDSYMLCACINQNNHMLVQWVDTSSGNESIVHHLWNIDMATANTIFNRNSTANSRTYLPQDICTDNEGNFYVVATDLGVWSGGVPAGKTNSLVIVKYIWQKVPGLGSLYAYLPVTGEGESIDEWLSFENGVGQAIVADNYGYIYVFYTTTGETGITQIGTVDMGVKKLKTDGTLIWTKHLGITGATLSQIRAIYTYDNKIHFSGQTDTAFSGFSQTNTIDTFFGTMTTDGVFAVKYQGGYTNDAVINALCCDDGYDYIGINTTTNNTKPKYALMKRTW